MMRYFVISLLLILGSSCSLNTTEGLRTTIVSKSKIVNPYFSNVSLDYVYKAKINIYGRYFGGILIVKKVSNDSHRMVFTTEFGSKIFDFLYQGDTFTKKFILEDLDKKIIVNTLSKDFKVLVSEEAEVTEQFVSETHQIYKAEANKRFNFYYLNASEKLDRIVNTSKNKEKFEVVFTSEEKHVAQKIVIDHFNMKLKIELDYFKKD